MTKKTIFFAADLSMSEEVALRRWGENGGFDGLSCEALAKLMFYERLQQVMGQQIFKVDDGEGNHACADR
ncbi:MAG: hypothetical protein PHF20_01495 [Halothiobacillaceae bacterium]|nr:hypothetical protein [Halothiobacillaceae bacterium]